MKKNLTLSVFLLMSLMGITILSSASKKVLRSPGTTALPPLGTEMPESSSPDDMAIFDPSTIDPGTLPSGMSVVNIDGTNYLQIVVDGWKSVLQVPQFDLEPGLSVYCDFKYSLGSASLAIPLTLSDINGVVQIKDTINKIDNPWGEGIIPSNTALIESPVTGTFSRLQSDFDPVMQYVHELQFNGQETTNWGATFGDTIWVGKIMAFYDHFDVLKTETAPVIDGTEDALWDQVPPVYLNKNMSDEAPTVDAYWKAMWADSGIFVLLNVQDDDHYPSWESVDNIWLYDGGEIYFDVNETLIDGLGAEDGQGHYQSFPYFADGFYGTKLSAGFNSLGNVTTGYYAHQLTGENWVRELFFPFDGFVNKNGETLSKADFLALDEIGFDVQIDDRDEGSPLSVQRKVWHNTGELGENWYIMDQAGTITLKEEAITDSVLVTFQVNMENQITQEVYLNGNFNYWGTPIPMIPVNGTTIYTKTVLLPKSANIEYKFINGTHYEIPPSECTVSSYNNRQLVTPLTNTVLDVVCFEECSACMPNHAIIQKTNIPPVIDGVPESTWDAFYANPIKKPFIGEYPTVTAWWKMMWDNNNFYVLVSVEDDDHYPWWEAGGQLSWNYDKVELYFDVNNTIEDGLGPDDQQGHYNVIEPFIENEYGTVVNSTISQNEPGGTHAYQLSDENYTIEYAIPFANIQTKLGNTINADTLLNRDAIGFDVYIIDQDEGITTQRHRKVWQNNGTPEQNWANMDDCGSITLLEPATNDSLALVALYHATDGDNWTHNDNWLTGPLDTWWGITLENKRVIDIYFEWGNNLSGQLPHEIGSLAMLRRLVMRNENNLTGPIPASIGNLTQLETLRFYNCNLTGLIPDEILDLSNLITLEISWNNFNPAPMPNFGVLSNLQFLTIERCNFTGEMHTGISGLTNLIKLYMGNNGDLQQGPIPDLSTLSNIEVIGMQGCNRSGDIPAWITQLPQLQRLNLSGNFLTGTIPTNFVNPQNILELDFGWNIYDEAPFPDLSLLTNLEFLALAGSNLTGNIPSWLTQFTNLTFLNLSFNQLDGNIPSDIGSLVNIWHLNLEHNKFNGNVPSGINSIINLEYCYLNHNSLSGNLPSLGTLTNLTNVRVNNNSFTFADFEASGLAPGSLDEFIYDQQDTTLALEHLIGSGALTVLDGKATDNTYQWFNDVDQIPGAINDTITGIDTELHYQCKVNNSTYTGLELSSEVFIDFSLHNDSLALVALYIATDGDNWYNNDNWLTGTLDTWWGITVENGRVTGLNLEHNNNLMGQLPIEIGNLNALNVLNINGNENLTGHIPSLIGNMNNLGILRFYDNELTGTIPPEILNLSNLYILELSWNNFDQAPMPDFGLLSNLNILTIEGANYTGEIPEGLSGLANLQKLYMGENGNLQDGPIPDLSTLSNLQVIGMQNCNRNGNIPAWITQLPQLQRIILSGNFLTGSIPSNFVNPLNILELDLGWNVYSQATFPDLSLLTNLESLSLPGSNLAGTIPAWLTQLTNLSFLNLSFNHLEGNIPSDIGNLVNVWHLNLQNNNLSGVVPASIPSIASLNDCFLNFNNLSGDLPPMGSMINLNKLGVNNNLFTFANLEASGIIPGGLNEFYYHDQDTILGLEYVMATNTLSVLDGKATDNTYQWYENDNSIPGATNDNLSITPGLAYHCMVNNSTYNGLTLNSEDFTAHSVLTDSLALVALYQATDGDNWYNNDNWLTGTLDSWWGVTVENGRVTALDLGWENGLSGQLPADIGNLNVIRHLVVNGNMNLTGPIPPQTGNLQQLEVLGLRNCSFTGTIPSEILSLSNLINLGLSWNNFDQAPMPDFSVLSNLAYLHIENANFTGEMPAGLSGLTNLISLFMGNNYNLQAGPIPDLSGLTNLRDIGINSCNRNGTIPAWIMQHAQLQRILVGGNFLTGSIPTNFVNPQNIIELDLGWNMYDEAAFPDLSLLTNLEMLHLPGSSLIGNIPAWLTQLTNLTFLNLSYNNLEGNIPSNIENLGNLWHFNLDHNNLSGSIPTSITSITGLVDCNLSHNRFSGTLPSFAGLTNLNHLWFHNNLFTFADLEASGIVPGDLDEFFYYDQDTVLALEYTTATNSLTVLDGKATGNNYQWYEDDISIAGALNDTLTEIGPGLAYQCKINNSVFTGLELSSEIYYSTVEDVIADFSIDGSSSQTGVVPLTVQFVDLSQGTPTSWLWDFGDGTTSATQSPSHTYTSTGTYTVSLTASNSTSSDTETKTGYVIVTQSSCAPAWQVVNYTNSTTAYCKVTIDGNPAADQDQIAAFVDGECRAIGDVVINEGLAYSNLVVQGETVETIDFKIWDASNCQELDACNAVQSNPGGNIGYPPDYIEVNVCFDVTQTINLETGWNLVSFYVDSDPQTAEELFSEASCTIEQVKTMTESWDPNAPAFLNTLTELNNTNVPGFFVNSSGSCSMDVTGAYINNNHLRDELLSGWNLIGYPYQTGQDVTDAYATLLGDNRLVQVKNNTSSYDPLVPEFNNTLDVIAPGEGYFIKVNTLVGNFTYPSPTGTNAPVPDNHLANMPNQAPATSPSQPSWTLVTYTNSTTAYGIVTIDGAPADPGDWVGAFVGDECRAMHQVIMNEGTAYANLQIQGESVETVSFKVWDASLDLDCEVALTVQSSPGDIIGYPEFLDIAASTVPTDLQVSNTTLSDTETDCFNAYNIITVAGDGTTVVMNSGSSANFIAGQSIRFLPGFHAQAGSYVDAHITTTGSFCDNLPAAPMMAAEPVADKSAEIEKPEPEEKTFEQQSMKVYPNPNNGRFTIKLENIESETRVFMYNSVGQKVYDVTMTEQLHSVELPNVQRGIYFIKAINNKKQFDQKIVIN